MGRSSAFAVSAVVAIAGGLLARAYGLDESLWLDEFSTLWVIEAGWADIAGRVASFHGQTALYYWIVRASVDVLGESEIALRTPSLVSSALTAVLCARATALIGSRRAAWAAGLLCWLAFSQVQSSVNARPYSLAHLGVALTLLGFLGAVSSGQRRWRVCLVLGSALAFWAHFIFVLPLAGLAAGYLWRPALRARYPMGVFARDLLVVAALCAPAWPFIEASLSRPYHVSWEPAPRHSDIGALLAPVALPIGLALTGRKGLRAFPPGGAAVLMAIVCVVLIVEVAWLFGPNLVTARYLGPIVLMGALLAGLALDRLTRRDQLLSALVFLTITATSLTRTLSATGTFSGLGVEDWRGAVATARAEIATHRLQLVLYRSGFVEEDLPQPGSAHPATRAPLRSPGERPLDAEVVSLTHRWSGPGRESYFDRVVRGRLLDHAGLVIISQRTRDVDGNYADNLLQWVASQSEAPLSVRSLPHRGVDVVVVTRTHVAPR